MFNVALGRTGFEFLEKFLPVWSKSMSAETILSGFRATGIWPFDPNANPEATFESSVFTHRALPDEISANLVADCSGMCYQM